MSGINFATLAGALGLGSVLTIITQAVVDKWKGKHAAEQDAWTERDKYARRWRIAEEALHTMRSWCHIRHESDYEDMPAWPDYPDRK